MTLIETMVAMAISSVLILGSIQMYTQARSTYRTTESIARMQENLRFSIDILDEDVRMAGFWGKTDSATGQLLLRDQVVVTCEGNDVTNWVMNLGNPVPNTVSPIAAFQTVGAGLDNNCPGINPRVNSDVLIVRHAAADQNVNPTAGVVQIQSNGSIGAFFDHGLPVPPEGSDGNPQIFDVAFNAYYVSNESKYDTSLPSLRRKSLVGNQIIDQEIIPGVENLQVRFGIDRNDDGQIDRYVNGEDPLINSSAVISTRLWLLVRSEQNEVGVGYVDNRTYPTPDVNVLPIDPQNDAANYPPTFRRMALSRTIVLRN